MSDHGIASRVLVVNAAYDRQLIKHFYQESATLGATHVVFTHLDELLHFGKLWEFVLDAGLAPLFASTGPNLADDCERDIVSLLVHKTLSAGKEAP
jgi:flagellar biosynthesis protein FlhF